MLKKFYFLTASALILMSFPGEGQIDSSACQAEQQSLAKIKLQRRMRDSAHLQSAQASAESSLVSCLTNARKGVRQIGSKGVTTPRGTPMTQPTCKPCDTRQSTLQVRSLQKQLSVMKGAVDQRDGQIRQLKAALANVQEQSDAATISRLRETISRQTSQNKMLGSQLNLCETKLAGIEDSGSIYEPKIRDLNSQISVLRGRYTSVRAQRDDLAKQLATISCEDTEVLNGQINRLKTLNTSLQAERDSLTAQVAALTGVDTSELEKQIRVLTRDNRSKDQTILGLRGQVGDTITLQSQVDNLRRQNESLQARLASLEDCGECDAALQREIDQLTATNETLNGTIISLNSTISDLRDNPDLSGQLTALTTENEILNTRIDQLGTKLDEANKRADERFHPEERDSMLSLIDNMNKNLVAANETIDSLNAQLVGVDSSEGQTALLKKLNDRIKEQAKSIDDKAAEILTLKTAIAELKNSGTKPGPVDPNNHPPIVRAEDVSIVLGKTQILELVKNDTDQDGDNLEISRVFDISSGINVTILEPDRKRVLVETIHNPLFKSFDYEVSDGRGGTDTGKVEISLERPNPLEPYWPWASVPVLALAAGGVFMAGRASKRTRVPRRPAGPGGGEPLRPDPKSSRYRKLPRMRSDEPEKEGAPDQIRGMVFAGSAMTAGSGLLPSGLAVAQPVYDAVGRVGYAQRGVPVGEDEIFGTGILISDRHFLSNRHVWEMFKDKLGGGSGTGVEFFAEKGSERSDFVAFSGDEPEFIEGLDAAIFTLAKPVTHRKPVKVTRRPMDELDALDIVVVGYPQAHRLTDEIRAVVEKNAIFGVKRYSEGKIFRHSTDNDRPYGVEAAVAEVINQNKIMRAVCHNASTLGGSSGSAVIDKKTGDLIALHFGFDTAYEWEEAANFAIAGEMLADALARITGET